MDRLKISINDEIKECDVLYTFKSHSTGNYYLICTDNTYGNNDELNIYSFIYYPKDKNKRLEKIVNKEDLDEVKEELADVISYCLLMADKLGVDPKQIVLDKMEKTAKKYPVEKAKGKSTKYNKL